MYSKEQASKLRQQFWTRFGQYMKPVPGAGGEPVNWLNYKTGKRHISFHLDANKVQASIAIEIKHAGKTEREICYQQFLALKKLMENETGFLWYWEEDVCTSQGEVFSRISQTLHPVNVLNEQDWPAIIAFLKPRIMALDHFWEQVKDGFD
jgi:Domain of unknown function (DUF4268)